MTRLLIIEPTRLRADFIALSLSNERGFEVVASVTDLDRVADHAGQVDVALLSMEFPNDDALAMLWNLVTNDACIRVIALGVTDSEGAILAALKRARPGMCSRATRSRSCFASSGPCPITRPMPLPISLRR